MVIYGALCVDRWIQRIHVGLYHWGSPTPMNKKIEYRFIRFWLYVLFSQALAGRLPEKKMLELITRHVVRAASKRFSGMHLDI